MTNVVIYKKNGYNGFELSGHAFGEEVGDNIVCAAISILSQTCVNAIYNLLNVNIDVSLDEKSGYMKVECPFNISDDNSRDINLLIANMVLGLRMIEEQYPKQIKIKIEDKLGG